MLNQLINFRQELHQYPELSGKEFLTAQRLYKALESLKPDILLDELGGTGVLAIFGNNSKLPTVFFRAELDALPIDELNDFEHKSLHPGGSHKCGHDGHMAILLGLAQLVAQEKPAANVGFLFQPAEETGAGARAVLADPQFAQYQPDYIFALHNLPGYPLHSIVVKDHAFTPAVKSMVFKLFGKTAHAAEPENGINPALAISEALQAVNLLSENSPENLALITPICIQMGEKAYGVSAGYGELHFTLRCYRQEKMKELEKQLTDAIATIAQKYQLRLEQESLEAFEANENDREATQLLREAALSKGLELIELEYPMKWGEDFGAFTQQFKGAIFGLGAGENCPALHHPDYDFPDAILPTGVTVFYACLQQLLKKITAHV